MIDDRRVTTGGEELDSLVEAARAAGPTESDRVPRRHRGPW